jgi:dCTP deaminase
MSMLPFEWEGQSCSVVFHKDHFDQNGKAILLLGAQLSDLGVPSQFTDPDESNATYDLRVGPEYRDHTESHVTALAEGDDIRLVPGAAVVIATEESVEFPKAIFGYISPKVSLLQDGLSNTSSKVDPGYTGRLLVTVFNLGKKEVLLRRGTAFCALSLHVLGGNPRSYNKPPKNPRGEGRRTALARFLDFVERKRAVLLVVVGLFSIVSVILELYKFFFQ